MKTATAKVGGITQNRDLGYACFHEKYYRVCIARAAVNKSSICEDSHAEHVQFLLIEPSQQCAASFKVYRRQPLFISIDPYTVMSNQFRLQLLTVKLLL